MNVAQKRHRGRVAEDAKSDGGDRAGVALGGEFAEHGMTASWAAALVAGEIEVHLWACARRLYRASRGAWRRIKEAEGTLLACARVLSWNWTTLASGLGAEF